MSPGSDLVRVGIGVRALGLVGGWRVRVRVRGRGRFRVRVRVRRPSTQQHAH